MHFSGATFKRLNHEWLKKKTRNNARLDTDVHRNQNTIDLNSSAQIETLDDHNKRDKPPARTLNS